MPTDWNPRLIKGSKARRLPAEAWIARWQRQAARRGLIGEVRRTVWLGMLLGLLAFQAMRVAATAATPRADAGGERIAGAVRVIDGDTFALGSIRVRIADIDAPEVHGRCAFETDLAARATARMRGLLAGGPFELHSVERDEDRYGRKLRIVTRGGQSLGDVLVAEGLARTWTGRREPWC